MGAKVPPARKASKWTMGNPAVLSLAKARERAREALEQVQMGKDPRPKKQAQTVMLPGTVGDLCGRYIDGYLKTNVRRPGPAQGEIDNHIRPRLGALHLADITRGHVREMLADIEPRAPVAANRALQRLRAIFNWAIENDLATANPTDGVKRPTKEAPRQRTLTDAELVMVWNATMKLNTPAKEYFQVTMLCGQRRDDVRLMHSRELDLSRGDWVIPASRYKGKRPHLIPLTDQLVAIISRLLAGDREGYGFTVGDGPYSNLTKPKRFLDKEAGVTDWVIHDLRRTLRTGLSRIGVRAEVSERVLGHRVGGKLGATYDTHEYRAEKLAALAAWGEHLRRILAGETADNVVSLGRVQA